MKLSRELDGAPVRTKLRTRMLLKLRYNRPPVASAASCRSLHRGPPRGEGGWRRHSVRLGSEVEKLRTNKCCPLKSPKRTLSDTSGMSALCQERTRAPQQTTY